MYLFIDLFFRRLLFGRILLSRLSLPNVPLLFLWVPQHFVLLAAKAPCGDGLVCSLYVSLFAH